MVNLPIPLLVSLNTLRSCSCQIDFGVGKLEWKDLYEAMLKMTADKHLSFEWYSILTPEREILIDYMEPKDDLWDKNLIEKLHIQLGHADVGVMRRILHYAGVKVEENCLIEVVRTCGFQINTGVPQPPRITKYIATCPGEVIALDVYYPSGTQAEPAIICVDSLTRYVASRFFDQFASSGNHFIFDYVMDCFYGCANDDNGG